MSLSSTVGLAGRPWVAHCLCPQGCLIMPWHSAALIAGEHYWNVHSLGCAVRAQPSSYCTCCPCHVRHASRPLRPLIACPLPMLPCC